jgi:hypothetical protein
VSVALVQFRLLTEYVVFPLGSTNYLWGSLLASQSYL